MVDKIRKAMHKDASTEQQEKRGKQEERTNPKQIKKGHIRKNGILKKRKENNFLKEKDNCSLYWKERKRRK